VNSLGFLRLLLASIVLTSHSQVTPVYTGVIAVECFFVISGFYMQLIIRERYEAHADWQRKFWLSRCLRIFIPYWVVCIAIIGFSLHRHDTDFLSAFSNPLSFLSNVFILGTEHIKLWRLSDGCTSYYATRMFIPQIWSVGIELIFYMMAPFLLTRSTAFLLVLTLLSLTGKAILLHDYYDPAFNFECGDGLLNGIFPLEIGIFTCGALGYRFYHTYLKDKDYLAIRPMYKRLLVTLLLATLVFAIGLSDKFPSLFRITLAYVYVTIIAVCVPFLFHASRKMRLDRLMGELSYSFYLCHLYIVQHFFSSPHGRYITFPVYEAVTLACALVIHIIVEKPLDALRHRYLR